MSGALLSASVPGGVTLDLSFIPSSLTDTDTTTGQYRFSLRFADDGFCDYLRFVNASDGNQGPYVENAAHVGQLHVRCVYISGTHLTNGNEDTWDALTTTPRDYQIIYTSGGGSDFVSGDFRFELSLDGGTTIHAASQTCTFIVGEIF